MTATAVFPETGAGSPDLYLATGLLANPEAEGLPAGNQGGDSDPQRPVDGTITGTDYPAGEVLAGQQADGELEDDTAVVPMPLGAAREKRADAAGAKPPRSARSRRTRAIIALGAASALPLVAACGSSLSPGETHQETGIIRTVAQNIAARAIRLSGGRTAVFTATQLGPRVAELTASSPAYTVGPDGGYPLDGDPADNSLQDPTPQETRILDDIETGFQGYVIIDVQEATPGVLEPSDAANVLSIDMETEQLGQNFPNNQVTTTDISVDSPHKDLGYGEGGFLPDWQIEYDWTPPDANDEVNAATDLDNPAGDPYWINSQGELGPVPTTRILSGKTTALLAKLLPHLDTRQQAARILSAHRLFLPY